MQRGFSNRLSNIVHIPLLSCCIHENGVVVAVSSVVPSASGDGDPYGRGIVGGIRVACIRPNTRGVSDGGIAPDNHSYHDLCGFLAVIQNVAYIPGDSPGLAYRRCGEMAAVRLGPVKCRAA